VRPTAPRPVLRMLHQLSLHRIGVHVFQLLFQLFLAPHIEIIKSPLPKGRFFRLAPVKRQWQLGTDRRSSPFQEDPRHFLLQDLQNLRGVFLGGFAHQQMHVFRHDDVSNQTEGMPSPNFIQRLYKAVPRSSCPEQRLSPITTERNEMKIALSIVPFKRIAHRGQSKPAPLKPKGAAPPYHSR